MANGRLFKLNFLYDFFLFSYIIISMETRLKKPRISG